MGHWYKTDGQPQYTLIGANGKERDCTLRDAKKLHLLPSVTTITSLLDKAGLLRYFHEQVIGAVFTQDRQKEGESFEDYVDRIVFASKQESRKASDRGGNLHNKLEDYFKKDVLPKEEDSDLDFIQPVVTEVLNIDPTLDGKWIPEQVFAHQLGYGGKVDLYCDDGKKGIVLDFKTKNTTDKKKFYRYNEHLIQLAAYRDGLGLPEARCFDLYFSSLQPNIIDLHEWTEDELKKGSQMFQCLLQYYKLVNNYDSSFKEEIENGKQSVL